jgi:hypothetical protein
MNLNSYATQTFRRIARKESGSTIIALLFVVLIIALIIVMPLAGIWSLNLLFKLTIPYSLNTWLASFVLIVIFRGNISVKKD